MEYFGCDYRNPADYEYIPPVVCKRPVAVERKKTMIARLEEWYDGQKPNFKFTIGTLFFFKKNRQKLQSGTSRTRRTL